MISYPYATERYYHLFCQHLLDEGSQDLVGSLEMETKDPCLLVPLQPQVLPDSTKDPRRFFQACWNYLNLPPTSLSPSVTMMASDLLGEGGEFHLCPEISTLPGFLCRGCGEEIPGSVPSQGRGGSLRILTRLPRNTKVSIHRPLMVVLGSCSPLKAVPRKLVQISCTFSLTSYPNRDMEKVFSLNKRRTKEILGSLKAAI